MSKIRECRCGSGEQRYALCDARGIFCAYVCGACEQQVRRKYRPEIFSNPRYEAAEKIEPDEPSTYSSDTRRGELSDDLGESPDF